MSKKLLKHPLSLTISCVLGHSIATAATIPVTQTADDGTGLIENTLSWAILQANETDGDDVIELHTDITLTGVPKRLIDSNITIQGFNTKKTVNGNNQFRPLFIKSGAVNLNNLEITNGMAKGGGSLKGGAGAGLGGALFIYDGLVQLNDVTFSNNAAQGGDLNVPNAQGGGGMFGDGNYYGGGGLFGSAMGNFVNGGYGGYGNYRNYDPHFGGGGNYLPPPYAGGFGGGGSHSFDFYGFDGGFGGGGGHTLNYSPNFGGGHGGFGGGGGTASYYNTHGQPGFAAHGKNAAGLGGAMFVRSGQITMKQVEFHQNHAMASDQAKGLGGGLFILHSNTQINTNNHGMPDQLPRVIGCEITFFNNAADSDSNATTDNDDFFDASELFIPSDGDAFTDTCKNSQNVTILGNGVEIASGDITPEHSDMTNFGAAVNNHTTNVKAFTVNNSGDSVLFIRNIYLENEVHQAFNLIHPTHTDFLIPSQSSSFRIRFTPNNAFSISTAMVYIETNDPDTPIHSFRIQGQSVHDFLFRNGFGAP